MNHPRLRRLLVGLALWALTLVPLMAADPIRVLLVVGGHDYQTNQFHQLFEQNPEVTFRVVEHPHAHAWLEPDRAADYDVLVLYDMWQPISEESKAHFVARLAEGKGLVALHHSLASYQAWDEYRSMIGGRYHLKPRRVDGVEIPGSTYRHDVQFQVKVLDRHHPITRGLDDFEIHDETYGGFEVLPGTKPLLSTSEPSSGPILAWHHTYQRGRVTYIQLGHDHLAYQNPAYARLLAQAIRWAAQRE
jgi:type 1 glutamine amidotransferase